MDSLYIVLVTSRTLHPTTRVGSVHWYEADARAEATRIRRANSYGSAYVIERQIEEKWTIESFI